MFQLRWIWRNMDTAYRWRFIIGLILSAVTSVALIINPFLTAKLIDEVIIPQNPDPLIPILMGMLAVQVARQGLRYTMVVFLEKASQNVIYNLRMYLFKVLQYQEMRFFDRNRTGDLMTRLSADLDWCRHFTSYLSYVVIDSVMMFAATLTLFFIVSWQLTLLLLAVTPLLMLITRLYSKKVRPKFVAMRDRLSEMNTAAQENIAGNRVVKAFAREDYEKKRFHERNKDYLEANLDINKLWLTFFPFIEMLANVLSLITIFAGGAFIIIEQTHPGMGISAGDFTIFTSLAWAMANPMRNLGTLINDLQRFYASASKVIEVYYSRPLIADRQDAEDHPRMEGHIEFRDVSFSFGPVSYTHLDVYKRQPPGRPSGRGSGKPCPSTRCRGGQGSR